MLDRGIPVALGTDGSGSNNSQDLLECAKIAALAALSFKWTGWLLWLALVLVFGRQQDMPLDDLTELTMGQRVFAAAMFLVFILVFVPVPIVSVP